MEMSGCPSRATLHFRTHHEKPGGFVSFEENDDVRAHLVVVAQGLGQTLSGE